MYERENLICKTNEYMQHCELTGIHASYTGLAQALSISTRTLSNYRKGFWRFVKRYGEKRISYNRIVANNDFEIVISAMNRIQAKRGDVIGI